MKDFKVTIKSGIDSISYEVRRTAKGAKKLGEKVANEAFYGQEAEVIVEEI